MKERKVYVVIKREKIEACKGVTYTRREILGVLSSKKDADEWMRWQPTTGTSVEYVVVPFTLGLVTCLELK